jgi:hypothetical protein
MRALSLLVAIPLGMALSLALSACSAEPAKTGDSGAGQSEDTGYDCAPPCHEETGGGGDDTGTTTENGPPDGLVVEILPAAPAPGEALTCAETTAATDPDGDTVSVSFAWERGGTDAGLTTATVPAGTTADGEVWTCLATPTDGTDAGPTATASVTISCPDADGDGARDAACGGTDCDDTDPLVEPGALEVLDGDDEDCDGLVDEAVVLVATGHACTAQGIAPDDGPMLQSWIQDLGFGADVIVEPSTGLDATSAPLADYDVVVYAKCGWSWQTYNQGTVDHLATAHANGVSTLVVDDDGSLHSTTSVTGATDLVLVDEPTSNGSTAGTPLVISSASTHPALAGPMGPPAAFTYVRDTDDTTLAVSGADVLMERADTGGPAWVLHTLSSGAKAGIILCNAARTNEGASDATTQTNVAVMVQNSVDWMLR